MNPETIERTQRFLFASEEEMNEANLPEAIQSRLLRLRDMYLYWLRHPAYSDKAIAQQIQMQYEVGVSQAYEDVRLLKVCLGNLGQVTRQWCQYVFMQRCEEGFAMAYHLKSALLIPHDRQVVIREVMPWRALPIVGLAALETTEEVENGVRLHSSKLTATLEEPYVFSERPVAFKATAVNGMQYLIGTAEPPLPLIQQNTILSSNSSETTATELVVNFTSQFSVLKTQYKKNIIYLWKNLTNEGK